MRWFDDEPSSYSRIAGGGVCVFKLMEDYSDRDHIWLVKTVEHDYVLEVWECSYPQDIDHDDEFDPDPDSDDNANNQYSVNAAIDMDPSPEDDRLQVNQSVRSSSPPPRAGGGEAQNTSALVPLLGIVQLLGQMVWYLRTGECVGGLWCGAGRVV